MTTFFAPAAQMHRGLVARREQSGRFDHDLHAELAPRQLGRVALGEHLERLAVEHDLIAFGLDLVAQRAVDRIVLEQMREGGGVGDVVDGDDLDVFLPSAARRTSGRSGRIR